jgi:SpoVK/Ycf46/Vps4 family AAA+-type ATPase
VPKSWSYLPEGAASNHRPAVPTQPVGPAPAAVEFPVRRAVRTTADLVVPDAVGERLRSALRQVQYHKVLFDEWDLKRIDPYRTGVALNLYGPSGTGKTLAAEAVAAHLDRGLIEVNYAEIESRYVGDTPKNIVRCFAAAQQADAVLIFNEADSILGSRLSNVTQSADHSVNLTRSVMLTQLDSFTGVAVFTTNFPSNYDTAFGRRIVAHVHFDLPDAETLERLWARMLPERLPVAGDVDLGRLAAASAGLAGGDLVNIVVAAAARAVGRTEADRHVTEADLLAEIDAVRVAHGSIGRPSVTGETQPWAADEGAVGSGVVEAV